MNWITQKEANELIYEGNSISYIYTKMKCYSDQVGMAYDALRKLGFDTSLPNGNKEMKNALILFVEKHNQLKQRNKEFFIAGFEAGKLNEKKANHKMPGTIMHADSAYEAYLGYRDIQNES